MNFHQVHNQALEWMSSSTATNNPSTTTKIEVVEDEEEDTKASASSSTTPTPPTTSATSVVIEREHMFDKVVTPSDVGKLNRLVIPKQHAEKYFPLDSSNNEKGLLLNFEDRTGKPWRFRYSYWNSSQSYVMTKGWSRFVKEKKLDAGDIVSFQRGVGDKDKLFIDWRRRPDASTFHLPNHPFQHHHHHHHSQLHYPHPHHNPLQHGRAAAASWTSGAPPAFVLRSHPYAQAQAQAQNPYAPPPQALWDHQAGSTSLVRRGMGMGMGMGTGHYGYGIGNVVNPAYPVTGSLVFVRSGGGGVGGGGGNSAAATTVLQNVTSTTREGGGAGGGGGSMIRGESGEEGMVYESVPVVQGKAAAKRLRLFGVNMECPISHQTHDFDILSSSSTSNDDNNHAHPRPHHHYHYNLLHQQQQQEQRQEQQQQQQQHEQHHLQQHQQQIPIISMGPPSASSPNQQNSTIHDHHPNLQLRSFFNNGTTSLPPPKGKSSTTSSSMSLDLDI